MPDGLLNTTLSIAGVTIMSNAKKSADHPNPYEVDLPAGVAGTLSTRTGDAVGVLTLAAGHGLQVADVIDLYWTGGRRYNVAVDSVNGNDVGFDNTPAAGGDNLPAENAPVVASKQVAINTQIDGDAAVLFGVHSTKRGRVDFRDAGGASIKAYDLVAGEIQSWAQGSAPNPLTGNPITGAKASNGETAAAKLTVLSLEDSTP